MQEKRLEEQRQAEEEHQRKLREKQQQDLEKAEMVRANREQQKELVRLVFQLSVVISSVVISSGHFSVG